MTAQWIDAPASDCEHEPNARGTECLRCGIPAETVGPDELTDALMVEIEARRLAAAGQSTWIDR